MSAAVLACAMVSMDANALALGRITVLSALGEPLRAEIELTEINAAETASLHTRVASPTAFKAAGVEFSPALSGVSITLQQRADGRPYLRLVGNRTVSEPFVDLLLEASSSAGRVSRDYTLLFDPPGLRSNAAAAPSAPTIPMVPRTNTSSAPLAITPAPIAAPEASAVRTPPPLASESSPQTVARKAAPPRARVGIAPAGSGASSSEFTVRPGDTAGKIAANTKSGSVSLDQMLVALLQRNPDAFIGGNVNRVKSGAILQIPGEEIVSSITTAQATQIIVAQSADFNAFRRNLATSVPMAAMANAARQASGKLQAKVEDRAPASGVPDKLMLSKGAVSGKPAVSAEQQIAMTRQANDSASRVAELSKNISDLNKIGAASSMAAGSQRVPASGAAVLVPAAIAKPLVPASVPTTPATPASMATPQVSQAVSANSPTSAASTATTAVALPVSAATATQAPSLSPASAPSVLATLDSSPAALPAPTASAVVLPATQVVTPENAPAADAAKSSFIEESMDNPLMLTGLALLVALLGGFALYRRYQQKQSTQIDSSFLESRLQPDSFFGASGGQHIDTSDTKDSSVTGSSLVYSPSQLDATGDVDPVAEADVYLAYGRDLQAEEILKEALRTSPARVAVHAKLLEIYAKRHDVKAFGVVATDAFKLTRGEGAEWRYMMEMGRELDPGNSMYQPGGQPPDKPFGKEGSPYTASSDSSGFASSTLPQPIKPQLKESVSAVDFDLDLDFSMDEPAVKAPAVTRSGVLTPPDLQTDAAPVMPVPMFDDFSIDFAGGKAATAATAAVAQKPAFDEPLSFENITFPEASDSERPLVAPPAKPAASMVNHNAPLEFDMSELSLDVQSPSLETSHYSDHSAPAGLENPLETKLSLAQEFSSLGDPEGARALAEEVLLEAKGPLKIKAQAFLNALS